MKQSILFVLLACLGGTVPASAQQTAGDWAWRPLLSQDGVAFTYIFYPRADEHNDGVVVKVENTNAFPIVFYVKVVFKDAEGNEVVEEATGSLEANEARTGDASGLFWVPFRDGRSIGEIGLRGYRIWRDGETGETSSLRHPGEPPPAGSGVAWRLAFAQVIQDNGSIRRPFLPPPHTHGRRTSP